MSSETKRIQSFEEFWPYYLGEHRNATSRRLHFLGTTGWLASCVGSAITSPIAFPAAMTAFAGSLVHGVLAGEKDAPRYANIAVMLGLPSATSPVMFPAGVVFAYACAWAGHFGLEKNRPATFEYPLWSFAADLRMWSHMVRGQLWSGDPLEELGLTVGRADTAAVREETPTVSA
jgi:hypothetical protein